MTEITGSPDCGNSPKNRLVQNLAVALETGQPPGCSLADDVNWHRPVGILSGREPVMEALSGVTMPRAVTIHHAIAHGKVGAANGVTRLADGSERRFCHVFRFTSAAARAVDEITSY